MPNDQSHDTRTTDPLARAVQAVNLTVLQEGQPDPPASGNLLFAPDFADDAGWKIEWRNQRYTRPGDPDAGGEPLPSFADYYYTSEFFHPNGSYPNGNGAIPNSKPVAEVTNEFGNHLDPNGYAYVMWEESHDDSGSEWRTDAVMIKETPEQYRDVFVDCYMKLNPGFRYRTIEEGIDGMDYTKIFRVKWYNGGDDGARFGFGLDVLVSFMLQLKCWRTNGVPKAEIRWSVKKYPNSSGSEYESSSYAIAGNIPDVVLDDNWHRYRIRLKFESAFEAGDGKLQIAYDDNLLIDRTQKYLQDEPPAGETIGWNQFSWSGNSFNPVGEHPDNFPIDYDTQAVEQTQWIAYSGYKVYHGVPDDSKTLFGE